MLLSPIVSNKENGNWSVPHDVLCIAAHDDSAQSSPAMRTAHNEICWPILRSADNQLASRSSRSLHEPGFHSQSFFVGEELGVRQDSASRAVQLLDECLIGGAKDRWRHAQYLIDNMYES